MVSAAASRIAATASQIILRRHSCVAATSVLPKPTNFTKTPLLRPLYTRSTTTPSSFNKHPTVRKTRRVLSTTSASKMSDEDYANFLAKSQKDYSKPSTTTAKSTSNKISVSSSSYPSIKAIGDDRCYNSESDEPFEGVSLDWEGDGLPDENSFAELVGVDVGDVEIHTTKEWDPRGQYEDVTKAVSEAGNGGAVKVYKTPGSGARVVYYVVAVDEKNKKLVGVKATAVES